MQRRTEYGVRRPELVMQDRERLDTTHDACYCKPFQNVYYSRDSRAQITPAGRYAAMRLQHC